MASSSFLLCVLTLPLAASPLLVLSLLVLSCGLFAPRPSLMSTTSAGLWMCEECGKVCKSRGGLMKHISVHKRLPRIDTTHGDFQRTYHSTLNGAFTCFSNPNFPDLPKGNCVVKMGNFFRLELHQFHHPQSPRMIGRRLSRALGLNLLTYYTEQPHSPTVSSISSSVSGV